MPQMCEGKARGDLTRAGHNVRKRQILELLLDREMTSEQVAKSVGISESAARHHLLRYWRYGLLDRAGKGFTPGMGNNPILYRTSERGRERLSRIQVKPYMPR